MAMASRASASMGGMEFVQFHPTGFHSGQPSVSGRTFLISEAVRGEGGLLLNKSGYRSAIYAHSSEDRVCGEPAAALQWQVARLEGTLAFTAKGLNIASQVQILSFSRSNNRWMDEDPSYALLSRDPCRFMPEYDDRLELAPRDIVARAIQDQMLMHGHSNVLLDISHCQRDHVLTHFPNIAQQCLEHGVDITRDPIPVAPAAHFMCGGVSVSPPLAVEHAPDFCSACPDFIPMNCCLGASHYTSAFVVSL